MATIRVDFMTTGPRDFSKEVSSAVDRAFALAKKDGYELYCDEKRDPVDPDCSPDIGIRFKTNGMFWIVARIDSQLGFYFARLVVKARKSQQGPEDR